MAFTQIKSKVSYLTCFEIGVAEDANNVHAIAQKILWLCPLNGAQPEGIFT